MRSRISRVFCATVASENGFVAAVRHTVGRSFGLLFSSGEKIVTGFAYLLPWLLAGGVALAAVGVAWGFLAWAGVVA